MREHEFFIGDVKLPITPTAINVKEKGKNSVVDLLNGNELNVLNKPGLTSYSFEFLLPNEDGFLVSSFIPPFTVYERLKLYMKEREVIPFIIIRDTPGLVNSIIKRTTVESLSYDEDSKNGRNLRVKIELKFYIPLKTKKYMVSANASGGLSNGGNYNVRKVEYNKPKAKSFVRGKKGEPLNVAIRRGGGDVKNFESIRALNKIAKPYDDQFDKVINLNSIQKRSRIGGTYMERDSGNVGNV